MIIDTLKQNKMISILLVLCTCVSGIYVDTWLGGGRLQVASLMLLAFYRERWLKQQENTRLFKNGGQYFSKNAVIPNVEVVNLLVPWGELLVGLGLMLGLFTKTAVFFGMVMNFSYMFSGTTSTNPHSCFIINIYFSFCYECWKIWNIWHGCAISKRKTIC